MSASHDFDLGIAGFRYSDLFDPERLRDLFEAFGQHVRDRDAGAWAAYEEHRRLQSAPREGATGTEEVTMRGDGPPPLEPSLLLRLAGLLSEFVGRLFRVEAEQARLQEETAELAPILRFKKELVSRRAAKRAEALRSEKGPLPALEALERSLVEIVHAVAPDAADRADPELRTAVAVARLLDARRSLDATERAMAEQRLEVVELWTARILAEERLRRRYAESWVSFRLPEKIRFPDGLVILERNDPRLPEQLEGPREQRRRRDGFKLTDPRWSRKETLDHAHYCVLCHDRKKDSCSLGYPHPRENAEAAKNPLGVTLHGCPLRERISEMHVLRREGDALGALAIVMVDNPLCPGTGHRICNDCKMSCIYQKQEPVNIPQVETGCLTDVLGLPYGFEIYGLLTRWNPLNVRRPYALPYNGRNVLVVGLGPAGLNLAQWLLGEGFGVVGIDGLKIEPLDPELIGAGGRTPRPVRDFAELQQDLDERVGVGVGGVAEYGITVRWDKTFLGVMDITLRRRDKLRFHGGVRFGGTISIDDAWGLGFDHIAIAAGAGRPTVVDMRNTLIRNVRTASDFLMGLQLTGAFKRSSLANLQLELPCIVIGSGLTAIDTATEALAYYPVQVEKILERTEALTEEIGEEAFWERFDGEEREILETFLDHGRQLRAERERAREAGEPPDFVPLLRQWGGVKICYRKRLVDSPAYRLSHEEIVKGFEEGIEFIEEVTPVEAVPNRYGAVDAVVFERARAAPQEEAGRLLRMPARTVFMAAGTSPNIVYEKEHPGTFRIDPRSRSFAPHRLGLDGQRPRLEPASGTLQDPGFFTSYEKDGRHITFFGDNHPAYAGSVVKAMASAKDGYPEIVRLLTASRPGAPGAEASPESRQALEARWSRLAERLHDEWGARVVDVVRLTPTVIEVILRAPSQARSFRPGQFFRLQNYETTAPIVDGTRLQMEGIALTGAWVAPREGLLSLIVLEMGGSSRLCALLRPGEQVVAMGPTGAPTEIPGGGLAILCGGGLGNAVLFSVARAFQAAGTRVVYFAGYKRPEDVFHQEDIERGADQVIWSVDSGAPFAPRRAQDRAFVGNIVEAMAAYAAGKLGGEPLFDLRHARRLISIGSDRMMAAVERARRGALASVLHPDLVSIASINSPMQCMMKEICGQCLQRHVAPVPADEGPGDSPARPPGGSPPHVFTCFNQDQRSDLVDWQNLADRLRMNSVEEKLASLWLTRLLRRHPDLCRDRCRELSSEPRGELQREPGLETQR